MGKEVFILKNYLKERSLLDMRHVLHLKYGF